MPVFFKKEKIIWLILFNPILITKSVKFKSISKILSSIVLTFVFSFYLSGQNLSKHEKLSILNNKSSEVRQLFYSSNCGYPPLVNGKIYNTYYAKIIGYQYFNSNNWEKGFVITRDGIFTDLLLKYDIINDKLIYHHLTSLEAVSIELNKQEIEGFSLAGHNFINVNLQDNPDKINGYYEILFNGTASLLIKWEKHIIKSSGLNREEASQKKTIYIKNGDKLTKIKNRKTIIEALIDKSKEINEYLIHKKFHVKVATDEDFIELMQFYDGL